MRRPIDKTRQKALAKGPRFYTHLETVEHRKAAEAVLPTMTRKQAMRYLRDTFNVGEIRAKNVVNACLELWKREAEKSENREENRERAIRRIMSMLLIARGRPNINQETGRQEGWVDKPNHAAVAKYEKLLMQLQGTEEPMKVELTVNVSQAVSGVIMNLTPEQVERYVERRKELERLAEEGRKALTQGVDA